MNKKTALLCLDCDEIFEPNYPFQCPACASKRVEVLATSLAPREKDYEYEKALEENYRYLKEREEVKK